jgi:UPF0716 family protein affecting phage T7 exclusion
MARGLGCLLLLLAIGALSVELWVFLIVRERCDDTLGPLLAVVATTYIGIRVAVHHGGKLPMDLLAGQGGRRLVAVAGGVLLAFPGFVSDALGLLLLLPPVQLVLGGLGQRVAMSLLRNVMGRMMGGGGFPGMPPGGFPGMPPGGPFPGMKPDDRVFKKPTKTIDTTVEK